MVIAPSEARAGRTQPCGVRPTTMRALSLLATGAVAVAALTGCGQGSQAAGEASRAAARASNRPAPDFTLTNQFGQRTSLDQYRGKAVLLAFVDSKCTTLCPLTTASMLDAVHELGSARKRVKLLGVDANPEAIRVADVRDYSAAHGMLYRWSFLTGTPAELARVWKSYGVAVKTVHGQVGHDAIIYVVDPQGRERSAFGTTMAYATVRTQAGAMALALGRALGLGSLPEKNPRPPPDLIPDHPARFPVEAGQGVGGEVRLGPEHPHLLVFVASWLRQTSNLRRRLAALDRYARLARRRGWPSPVAVDLASVERSPRTLPRWLARQRLSLDYPIISDRSGALADGYRVRDAPWIELTSARGRIVSHHDGWVRIRALQRAVSN